MTSDHTVKLTISVTLIAFCGMIWTGAAAFSGKADKTEVNIIREDVNELSAKRREDFIIQSNILKLLEKMDQRMGKTDDAISTIKDNQIWQMEGERKRRQFDDFNSAPTSSPPSKNVVR